MLTIGQFSKVTGLSIKTLRHYHERGLLMPSQVDAGSKYRFYDQANAETARVIVALREMEFPLDEIKSILSDYKSNENILGRLEKHKLDLEKNIQSQRDILGKLDQVISLERENGQIWDESTCDIEERELPSMLIGGIRLKGRYSDMGRALGKLGRSLGRRICGKCMCLYFDDEYREDDAEFEPFFPIQKRVNATGISVRELPACRAVCLKHFGPYEQLGRSYAKAFEYVSGQELELVTPSREVFLKGPGIIFRGNPNKYVTEIQLIVG